MISEAKHNYWQLYLCSGSLLSIAWFISQRRWLFCGQELLDQSGFSLSIFLCALSVSVGKESCMCFLSQKNHLQEISTPPALLFLTSCSLLLLERSRSLFTAVDSIWPTLWITTVVFLSSPKFQSSILFHAYCRSCHFQLFRWFGCFMFIC